MISVKQTDVDIHIIDTYFSPMDPQIMFLSPEGQGVLDHNFFCISAVPIIV